MTYCFLLMQNYLDWPKVTGWTIAGIIIFAVIYYVTFTLLKAKIKDDTRDETRWYILQSFLSRHNLVTHEIKIIRQFFNTLNNEEKVAVLDSRSHFHEVLIKYLKEQENTDPEITVTIIDKLFPLRGHLTEVVSLNDLYPGEMAALEAGEKHYLGTIMKMSEPDILLKLKDFKAQNHNTGDAVNLYVYRPVTGGYLLSCSFKEIGEEAVVIRFSGEINEKGEHHFMADIKVDVTFVPWPLTEKKSRTNRINGFSVKISDRAVLFSAKYKDESEYLAKKNDLWLGAFVLPGGYKFSCRGVIKKSQMEPDKFIFQFLDAPEIARKVLFSEIRERRPVREKMF